MVSCSLSLSLIRYAWYVVLFCLLWIVVVDKKEKRRALRFTWLCYLVYVDFASSWLDLTLILIESTFTWYDIYIYFFLSNILLKLSGIMVEVENDYIPHRVIHLALAIMLLIHVWIKFLFCFVNYCSFAGRLYSRLIWFGIRDKSPGITLFLWYVQLSSTFN
jgi:hypothetical protein